MKSLPYKKNFFLCMWDKFDFLSTFKHQQLFINVTESMQGLGACIHMAQQQQLP